MATRYRKTNRKTKRIRKGGSSASGFVNGTTFDNKYVKREIELAELQKNHVMKKTAKRNMNILAKEERNVISGVLSNYDPVTGNSLHKRRK